jgi:hypothetical protein
MAITYNTAPLRNDRLDAIETAIGTSPILRIWTGAKPANCAAASTGTLLVAMTLPSNWMTDASGGVKSKNGVWSGTGASAGTAGYFRIFESTGITCHIQGTAGTSGTDMILDGATIAVGQVVTVLTFSITAPGA